MIDEGMKRLGKLANSSDYKEWEDIEHKFNFQITPDVFTSYNTSNDTRVNLSEKQRKAIENSIASNYEANFKSLLEEEKKTLEESVQNIIDALKKDGSGKSFFKDSVFKNLKEKVERVRDLNRNIYQSAELDKAIDIIVGSLASVNDIDSLRDKGEIGKSKRAKVSADMEKAKSSLNQNTLGKIFQVLDYRRATMSSYDKSKRALHGVLSANEVMVKAKSKLMNSESGLASILLGLPLEEDSSFDTMATDGKVIKYNPDFALSLPMDEIKAVLIHEALHVVWGHHLRRGDRHPKLWNIATDYAINGYIVYKLGEFSSKLPEGALVSDKYIHKDGGNWSKVMSADEIYDILFDDDEALEEAIEQMQQQMGDDSDENESQGQGQDDNQDESEDAQGSGDGDEESDEESEGQGSGGDADDDAETGDDENITGNRFVR